MWPQIHLISSKYFEEIAMGRSAKEIQNTEIKLITSDFSWPRHLLQLMPMKGSFLLLQPHSPVRDLELYLT